MTDANTNVTRRQALYGLGGVSALALVPGCAGGAYSSAASQPVTLSPDELLDQIYEV